jgi:hypothetical protein
MRKVVILLLAFFVFPVSTLAAQVFGSIKFQNRSVGEGVEIKISCNQKDERKLETDRFGSYSQYLPSGKCTFKVNLNGQWSKPYPIYPDESDPVRYDFELVSVNGQLELERK